MHPALPGFPNFKPKAKNLIYLHMNGAPAQMDLFDHKPVMEEYFDKDLPDSVRNNQRITGMTSGQARFPVAPSKFKFEKCGKSGIMMSELVPHMKEIADEISMIKSVHTEAINHDPACTFVMTGSEVPGKPSLGSWLSYGLGSTSQDLPAFEVFTPTFPKDSQAHTLHPHGAVGFFLQYDGVALRGVGDPVLSHFWPIRRPTDHARCLGKIKRKTYERFGDPETQTDSHEMAVQTSVPELTDCPRKAKRPWSVRSERTSQYLRPPAIMARRLIERGV